MRLQRPCAAMQMGQPLLYPNIGPALNGWAINYGWPPSRPRAEGPGEYYLPSCQRDCAFCTKLFHVEYYVRQITSVGCSLTNNAGYTMTKTSNKGAATIVRQEGRFPSDGPAWRYNRLAKQQEAEE